MEKLDILDPVKAQQLPFEDIRGGNGRHVREDGI